MDARLRPVRPEDAPALSRMLNDPLVSRYMVFPPVDEEILRGWMELEEDREGPRIYHWWAVELPGVAGAAGCAGLVREPLLESAEIWYLLDQPYWGQGHGRRIAQELIERGFRQYGLHRLWAHVVPDNTASVRILESCGMRREGSLRANLPVRGQWHDSYLYALLREEWTAPPSGSVID